MTDDFDLRAIARALSAGAVFKWIAVIAFGVFVAIMLAWLAAFLWGAS